MEILFSDIGKKIKTFAKVVFVLECIASVIAAIAIFNNDDLLGAIVLFGGPIASFILSWMTYGFGEIIDKLCEIAANTSGGIRVQVKGTAVNNGDANTASLLNRAFMFLEDGDWEKADDFCEQVLNQNPENAEAYLGKLMAELKVGKKADLKNCEAPFDSSSNYQKAVRFGDADLPQYITYINERNESTRLTSVYNNAKKVMNAANTEWDFKAAADKFAGIPGFEDADALAEQCREKAEQIKQERLAKEEADRQEAERKAEERRIAAKKLANKLKKVFAIGVPVVAACIAFLIVLKTVIIPNIKYNSAVSLINDGKIVEAYERLIALNGYKDSTARANEISNRYRIEKLKIAEVGDIVYFGAYEQDNNLSNGKEDIEWLVLAKENGKALVISKYALDCQKYNTSHTGATWETCSLRKWMNGTFINAAFSAEEQVQIQNTTVSADKNPQYSTYPGNATTDKVFLLSIAEAKKYLPTDESRKCVPTAYAKAQKAYTSDSYKTAHGEDPCFWWLRSPGSTQSNAASVRYDGSTGFSGRHVNYGIVAVRPAMWINLDA